MLYVQLEVQLFILAITVAQLQCSILSSTTWTWSAAAASRHVCTCL